MEKNPCEAAASRPSQASKGMVKQPLHNPQRGTISECSLAAPALDAAVNMAVPAVSPPSVRGAKTTEWTETRGFRKVSDPHHI